MRRFHSTVVIYLLVVALITACGTLDWKLHLTIKPSGEAKVEQIIKGSGVLGANIIKTEFVEQLRNQGWDVKLTREGEYTILAASQASPSAKDLAMFAQPTGPVKGSQYITNENFFFKDHKLGLNISPNEAFESSMKTNSLTTSMIESMLKISMTVTLPGEITATNADSQTKDSGTWLLSVDALAKGKTLKIESREIFWERIIGVSAGGLVFVVAIVVGTFWYLRKRAMVTTKPPQPAAT